MSRYLIQGGKALKGEITSSGNKNAALPCIAAALLTEETVVLHNIPDIEDVHVMLSIMRSVGADVQYVRGGACTLRTGTISGIIPEREAADIRASILFAGPLLATVGKVVLPPPGGDVIGLRRLDTHFLAFKSMGVRVEMQEDNSIILEISGTALLGADIFLEEMSVTATENTIMAAAAARGTSVIRNAASEPHIQDLCHLLVLMGVKISGIGSNLLVIEGCPKRHGAEFTIGPDFMEIGSYIGLAAATKGEVTINNVDIGQLAMIRNGFKKVGVTWEEFPGERDPRQSQVRISAEQQRTIVPDISGMIPKIDDAPWPGFPPDLLSIITVVATQSEGTVLIHEKLFESRMFFIDMLIRMGARIILCDPHRAVVSGPCRLRGTLVTSPDIRAGMALVIAALSAHGQSEIQNVYQIERGYEDLCRKLRLLGADIVRES